jgi:hypothetical protein
MVREDFYKYKLYLVIAILVIIIMLLVECNRRTPKQQDCGEFKTITFDTLTTYKSHIDTIPFIDTIPYYVKIEVPIPIFDTTDQTNNYYTSFEDSLITGEILSKVDGVLINQSFTYAPKFPKYIIKTDSITNTITITKELEPKVKLFVGVNAGGNRTTFNLSPQIMLMDKKERAYTYDYNIIDKTHNFGYLIKLK